MNKKQKDKVKTILAKLLFSKQENYLVLPAGVRWGNILYFLLQAEVRNFKIIARDEELYKWLQLFPSFKNLVKHESEIGKYDINIHFDSYFQFLGEEFSRNELEVFINKHFKNHEELLKEKEKSDHEALYINIRRGDYYIPKHIENYGFNIEKFLKYSFNEKFIKVQKRIRVISDDIDWCKNNLQFLVEFTDNLIFEEQIASAEEAFLRLSTAKKLLISNSTFCYWAAYISTHLYEDHEIFAPDFVNRIPKYKNHKQYLKDWQVINGFNYDLEYK